MQCLGLFPEMISTLNLILYAKVPDNLRSMCACHAILDLAEPELLLDTGNSNVRREIT
jgi:hypothetical protein